MNHGPFDNDMRQCVVSYQLLQLLRWLYENEQEGLKKVIARCLKNGLEDTLYHQGEICESDEELQESMSEFFSLLEALLYELLNENDAQKVRQRVQIPAIDHIDAAVCDNTLVAMSLAKVADTMDRNPRKDPKEMLCKELLKRWKPAKKLSMH